MRSRARVANFGVVAAGVAIVGALISGVAGPDRGTDAAATMSAAERDQRRTAFLDALWQPIAEEYPEAIRPEVVFGRVVDDRAGRAARVVCLREAGIVATVDRGDVLYSSSQGQTPIEVAVRFYSCTAKHPNIRDMTAGLDRDQLGDLWDHYTAVTRPCLAAIGQRTWIPPSREQYRAEDGHHTWNPYLPLRGSRHSQEELDVVEARCPAVPRWLDFRTA